MLHLFKYVHKALRLCMHISATSKKPIHELCFLFGSVSKLVLANVCTLYTHTVYNYRRPRVKCLHFAKLITDYDSRLHRLQLKSATDDRLKLHDLNFSRITATKMTILYVPLVSLTDVRLKSPYSCLLCLMKWTNKNNTISFKSELSV